MKREKVFIVVFKMWIIPYHMEIPVWARDEGHAKRIARRMCKFGVIDQVLEPDAIEAEFVVDTSYPATEKNTAHLVDVDRDID